MNCAPGFFTFATLTAELKVVEHGPDVLADVVAIWVADGDGGVGHLPGRLGERLDGHLLRVVSPIFES